MGAKARRRRRAASRHRNVTYAAAAILVLGAAGVWFFGRGAPGPAPGDGNTGNSSQNTRSPSNSNQGDETRPPSVAQMLERFPLPEITPSRFRNASKSVAYVGTQACIDCHRDEHKSYLETTHSRSLADVDAATEPPDAEFFHELSGRHYRIYRDKAALRLREYIDDEDGKEVILADYPARYRLGSGNYGKMYLVKVDDFLIEAPVQWYPRLNSWGMSPGYEKDAHQQGFSREIGPGCLGCHAGRVDTIDGADLRLNVAEMAIGCERCHGPGALHVKERRAGRLIQGTVDDSIVNLRHLSRERQEDVCSQCHLSGSADVPVRGRAKSDFRPGMRLADFLVSFRVDRPDSAMTVSGQIEQMRLSRCYRESQSMTCATCHDPHAAPPAESEKLEHYRNKCLTCHTTESCGLTVEARLKQQKQDNCMTCHMPRGPTDIPHLSFTHHRVGIHTARAKEDKLTEADRLVPVSDISQLPEIERLRLAGLADNAFAGELAAGLNDESRDDPSYRELSLVFVNRGRKLLDDVRSRGLYDADIEVIYSHSQWRRDPDACIALARKVLQSQPLSPENRHSALSDLASTYFDQRQIDVAFPYLEELVTIERSEISLMLLGICHQQRGDLAEAARLINQAILDSPDRADLHVYLARVYERVGNSRDAWIHTQRARLLRLKVPQPQESGASEKRRRNRDSSF